MRPPRFPWLLIPFFILLPAVFFACAGEPAPEPPQDHDWPRDWAVPRDFSLSIDTEGYDLPSSIAFVPNPPAAALKTPSILLPSCPER